MTHGCTVHGLTLHRTFFNVRNRKLGAPRTSDEDSHSWLLFILEYVGARSAKLVSTSLQITLKEEESSFISSYNIIQRYCYTTYFTFVHYPEVFLLHFCLGVSYLVEKYTLKCNSELAIFRKHELINKLYYSLPVRLWIHHYMIWTLVSYNMKHMFSEINRHNKVGIVILVGFTRIALSFTRGFVTLS